MEEKFLDIEKNIDSIVALFMQKHNNFSLSLVSYQNFVELVCIFKMRLLDLRKNNLFRHFRATFRHFRVTKILLCISAL